MKLTQPLKITLLLIIVIFTSCQNNNQKRSTTETLEISSKPFATTFKKLQGSWKSLEDSLSVITFTADKRSAHHAGTNLSSSNFLLAASCPSEEILPESSDKRVYIVTNDFCWSINVLNEQYLELTYMDRGNTLSYERVK